MRKDINMAEYWEALLYLIILLGLVSIFMFLIPNLALLAHPVFIIALLFCLVGFAELVMWATERLVQHTYNVCPSQWKQLEKHIKQKICK